MGTCRENKWDEHFVVEALLITSRFPRWQANLRGYEDSHTQYGSHC